MPLLGFRVEFRVPKKGPFELTKCLKCFRLGLIPYFVPWVENVQGFHSLFLLHSSGLYINIHPVSIIDELLIMETGCIFASL